MYQFFLQISDIRYGQVGLIANVKFHFLQLMVKGSDINYGRVGTAKSVGGDHKILGAFYGGGGDHKIVGTFHGGGDHKINTRLQ